MSTRGVVGRFLLVSAVPCGLAVLAPAAPGPSGPEKVSIGDAGAQPDGGSSQGAVTGNGRFVAFFSSASNLLALGTPGTQVYVRDRESATNLLVSHTPAGAAGNSGSHYPAISDNGRYVVFGSDATDLVAADGNAVTDVFLADMQTGVLTRISEAAGGGDGDGESYCFGASISKNGRFAVYTSAASNLVGDDANGKYDVFLYDRVLATTTLVSRGTSGAPSNGNSLNPSLSSNGRYITYFSNATDLVAGDTMGQNDIFVYDARKGTTAKASPGMGAAEADGNSAEPVVSNNGRWVAFDSIATNLVPNDTNGKSDTFLYDRKRGAMGRMSALPGGTQGNDGSYYCSMSANGKVLVFSSHASNLSPDDNDGTGWDVFRVDLKTGALTLLSRDTAGTGGNGDSYSYAPSLSSNGHYLVFSSIATNLVAVDTNGHDDEFLLRLK